MSILDGTTVIWDGEVHLTQNTDLSTGVLTLVLTPKGGVGALPALVAGDPGLPPVFDSVNLHEVAFGDTLPPSTFTLVSPGGPGVASHYTADIYVHSGEKGDTGASNAVLTSPDLSGTATDGYILQYVASTGKLTWVAQRVGGLYIPPPTGIFSTSGNGNLRTLAQLTVPQQPYDWRPLVWGLSIVTGTVNTSVDLIARIGDISSGDVAGFCPGLSGVKDRPIIIPSFGDAIGPTSSYAKVAAGDTATITLVGHQTTGATDNWTTNLATTSLTVEVKPLQP